MTKSLPFIFIISLFYCSFLIGQRAPESEFRILKNQFPTQGLRLITEHGQPLKQLKFYKEIDSATAFYEAKFKKDRLWYGVQFNENGELQLIQIVIKPIDIPNETYTLIHSYLNNTFSKLKIKRIQQQYYSKNQSIALTFRNAFQNLILPYVHYEFIITGKKNKHRDQYELLFDAEGNLISIRTVLPQNYDHILY